MINLKCLKSLVVGSLLTISSVSMAATATVNVGGTVTSTLAVSATATTGAGTLDLAGATERIIKVADITMSTNNEQGLSITTSDGNLTKTGGTSIAYLTTTVADNAVAPATTAFNATLPGMTTAGTLSEDLYIKYTPAALQDPGTYAGVITITVTDL